VVIGTIYSEEKIQTTLNQCRCALEKSAFDTAKSKGRRDETDRDKIISSYLNPYQLDTWKIINSKAHRRLKHKTQVIAHSSNSHIRTRSDHTEETVKNAKIIATILGLNVDLVEAIATGHDIGHTPFGHIGEVVLSEIAGHKIRHEKHGVFIAQHIERKGMGLNLTYETLLGIAMHSRGAGSLRQTEEILNEIAVVMYSDKLSYLFSDYNDVKRHGLLPVNFRYRDIEELGKTKTERVNITIAAIVEESARKGRVVFSEGEVYERFEEARKFMWKNVYEMIDWDMHADQLRDVYRIAEKLYSDAPKVDPAVLVSLMTDKDVMEIMTSRARLRELNGHTFDNTSVGEILPSLYNKEYKYWELDLDWVDKKEKNSVNVDPRIYSSEQNAANLIN
jgi:dGTPase